MTDVIAIMGYAGFCIVAILAAIILAKPPRR